MRELIEQLNHQAKLYDLERVPNALGQDTLIPNLVKERLYCGIIPANSLKYKTDYLVANKEELNITHKIICRKSSVLNPNLNMYLEIDGRKYYVRAYDVDYRRKDRIELYCEVKIHEQ